MEDLPHPPARKGMIMLLSSAVAVAMVVVSGIFLVRTSPEPVPRVTLTEQSATPPQEPQKTDFGSSLPVDFPTDIPTESGVKVEQSYGLNYAGQKQLTIVFASAKTVEENYALYDDFLTKQGWLISNKHEGQELASLYGTKENNEINVTISETRVSISVLKK